MYSALLRWHTKGVQETLHQETLDNAKIKAEEATRLRSMNEKLLKRVRALGVPPRLEHRMGYILKGKIKCMSFWNKIPECAERAFCSVCKMKKNIKVLESEQHMCLDCEKQWTGSGMGNG